MKNTILIFCFLFFTPFIYAQSYEERDIKSFGAKGDGLTNDHDAFERAAAYFNQRGGNGKLIISAGTYVVGKQTFTQGKNGAACYQGRDVLHFTSVHHFTIEGELGSKLLYMAGLRFGAFDPATGKPYDHGNNYFVNYSYAAIIGHCIYIDKSEDVTISSIELDGNNSSVILGGIYGDVGRQLPHYGIFLANSKSVTVNGVKAHHFALDGICVANKASDTDNNILLLNSSFEYNSRQGLSWVGGNSLTAKGCKFNHTGQGKFNSAPGAGVDIEAEWGPNRNGKFEDCEFVDNKGCGLVADSGDSGNCEFTNCTFWGLDSWSIWVNKPGFTFRRCNIYGSIVWGYNATNDNDATKYIDCHFEDKPYEGRQAYGQYLVESNYARRVHFLGCTFVCHTNKLIWIELSADNPVEKHQINNCTFTIYNTNLPQGDWIAVLRGIRYKNCKFAFSKNAQRLGYWLNTCCNVDAGGNKITTIE